MLGDIVDRVFDGSRQAVVLSLSIGPTSRGRDLKELRQILRQKTLEKVPMNTFASLSQVVVP